MRIVSLRRLHRIDSLARALAARISDDAPLMVVVAGRNGAGARFPRTLANVRSAIRFVEVWRSRLRPSWLKALAPE